jgi:hypothetical protein
MLNAHLNLPPPQPSQRNPALTTALDQVIATGMAKNPNDRYPTAGALAAAAGARFPSLRTDLTQHANSHLCPSGIQQLGTRDPGCVSPTGHTTRHMQSASNPGEAPYPRTDRDGPNDRGGRGIIHCAHPITAWHKRCDR